MQELERAAAGKITRNGMLPPEQNVYKITQISKVRYSE